MLKLEILTKIKMINKFDFQKFNSVGKFIYDSPFEHLQSIPEDEQLQSIPENEPRKERPQSSSQASLVELQDDMDVTDKPKDSIEVGSGDFKAIVDFIEKNGFVVKERGVSCDHQYTFFDSKGNRHAMITIKRDENRKPSMTGQITHISVWAYREGIKDQSHFFGYFISKNTVQPFTTKDSGWEEKDDVQLGYKEFLKKVKESH